MFDPQQLRELQQAYRAHDFYLNFASETARQVLNEIIEHPYFPGSTDPSVLELMAVMIRTTQPRRMLQLGTHIGFSSVFIADLLSRNATPGHLVTVDPDSSALQLARGWVGQAGLSTSVTFLEGFSTDTQIDATLRSLGPFDLIYLDSSHAYAATLIELSLIFEQGRWLDEHGLLLMHDAAAVAAQWDPTGQGGVHRALIEWIHSHLSACRLLILEEPLWPGLCGLSLLTRWPAAERPALAASVAELEAMLAAKNEHIAGLERTIDQIANGRVMRVMNTAGAFWRAFNKRRARR